MPQPRGDDAEVYFVQSLEVSRRQAARGWELRTAIDLAKLWAGQGRSERARMLLQPVFEQFIEGRGHSRSESGRTSVGDLRLTLTTKHSYASSRPLMSATLSYVARGGSKPEGRDAARLLHVICHRRAPARIPRSCSPGRGRGQRGWSSLGSTRQLPDLHRRSVCRAALHLILAPTRSRSWL